MFYLKKALHLSTVLWVLGSALALAQTPAQTAQPAPLDCTTLTRTPPAPAATTNKLSPQDRLKLFDTVWQTVSARYVYPDFGGLDWNAIRQEYTLKIQAAADDQAVYDLIGEMIAKLKDGHSGYLDPKEAEEDRARLQGNPAYVGIGITFRYVKEGMQITDVFAGGPAALAGLKARDIILSADDKACPGPSEIRGLKDTSVRLQVRSGSQAPRLVTIQRQPIARKPSAIAQRIGTNQSVGYLRIPTFEVRGTAAEVETALRKLLDGSPLKGLILDVRGNGGGLLVEGLRILGQFVSGPVGEFRGRDSADPFVASRGSLYENLKSVPLVVLVDGSSASMAEIFAGSLQASGRAKVVGVRSSANTEVVTNMSLFDGSSLWLAIGDYYLSNGTRLGVSGVVPDVEVGVDWLAYPEDQDPQVLKALELLQTAAAR